MRLNMSRTKLIKPNNRTEEIVQVLELHRPGLESQLLHFEEILCPKPSAQCLTMFFVLYTLSPQDSRPWMTSVKANQTTRSQYNPWGSYKSHLKYFSLFEAFLSIIRLGFWQVLGRGIQLLLNFEDASMESHLKYETVAKIWSIWLG